MPLVWPLALLLAAAPDLGLGAPPAAKPGGCPADARVEVNLAAWRSALQQATDGKRRDELLAELKLALDLPEASASAREARVSLLGVDDTAVLLEPGGRPDHVVQVRYALDGADDKSTITLAQVLRPLEGRAWCALGAELGRRDEGARKLTSHALAFVPLVSARAKAVEVQLATSELRRSETRREYWIVDASKWRLRKIFDERVAGMESSESGAATTSRIGKLTLAGGFPKRLELREVTKHGGCEARTGDAPCDDSEPAVTFTFVYDGTRYVQRK